MTNKFNFPITSLLKDQLNFNFQLLAIMYFLFVLQKVFKNIIQQKLQSKFLHYLLEQLLNKQRLMKLNLFQYQNMFH